MIVNCCSIDRKKDLIKLRGGEYVSLTKVEMVINRVPIIDNSCLCASSSAEYTVLLICPNTKQLAVRSLLSSLLLIFLCLSLKNFSEKHFGERDWTRLVAEERFNDRVLQEITEACKRGGIERFETPQKIHIVTESWTPETGLVTDALKLKRKAIENKYQDLIEDLYTNKYKNKKKD